MGEESPLAMPRPEEPPTLVLVLVIAVGSLGMAIFGYQTGVMNGALMSLKEDMPMRLDQYEWLVASTMLAAAFGSIISAALNSCVGRKPVLVMAALVFVCGALVSAAANGFWMLLMARIMLGFAVGFVATTMPCYMSEISPPSFRGRLLTMSDLSVVVGQLVASIVNGVTGGSTGAWRWSMGLAVVPALLMFAGVLVLPESPRWLVQRGQAAAAKKVLSSVIRSPERVDAEMEEMSRSVSQGLPPHVAFVRLWSTPPLRRASQLGIGFMAVQQLAGINTIMFYSGMLMQRGTGFDTSVTEWLTALCCFAQLLGVCVALYSIDRDGRRVTALRSAFGVTTALLLVACYSLHTTSAGEIAFNKLMVNNSFAPILVVLIMVYLFCFGAGLSAVPWVMVSEIYPMDVRPAGVAQAVTVNWLFAYGVSMTFLSMLDSFGEAPTFFLYTVFAAVGGLWIWSNVPETLGMRLEHVAAVFADHSVPTERSYLVTRPADARTASLPPSPPWTPSLDEPIHPAPQTRLSAADASQLVMQISIGTATQQMRAAGLLCELAKDSAGNKKTIAAAGAIPPLLAVSQRAPSPAAFEAEATLKVLAHNPENRLAIAAAGSAAQAEKTLNSKTFTTQGTAQPAKLAPLVLLASTGTSSQKEQAATLLSELAAENYTKIAAAGAIPPLVSLARQGTSKAAADAKIALQTLALDSENSAAISAIDSGMKDAPRLDERPGFSQGVVAGTVAIVTRMAARAATAGVAPSIGLDETFVCGHP